MAQHGATTLILSMLLLIILNGMYSGAAYLSLDDVRSEDERLNLFNSWCQRHSKVYSEQERLRRFQVFKDNLAYIDFHNSRRNSTYWLGLNEFSDLTNDEFTARYLGLTSGSSSSRGRESSSGSIELYDIPSSLDWRDHGAVTRVKNQGSCGACWAFSATGAIEGINKIVTDSLVNLSEQELCDCDTSYNVCCDGGLMDYAFQWVIRNHGIDTEEDYPYAATQKTCNAKKLSRHVVTIDGYADVPANNEKALFQVVAAQPVSVGIAGSGRLFQLYAGGIFTGPCSSSLDHAALIVGYDSKDGLDYWIVKNSWGTSWGMSGYAYMVRNRDHPEGICGINMLASYPIKTTPNPPSPPPTPHPVKCDALRYCPAGNTCCCTFYLFRFCVSWGCCRLESAVCCKDHHYCCPQDHPICDTNTGLCLKATGNMTRVAGLTRTNASIR